METVMSSRHKRIDMARLKNSIDTPQFFTRETGRLVPSGDGWKSAVCPFHDDTNPSLRVLIPVGAFKCQACGAKGGDVISFVEQKYDVNFVTAIRYLQDNYGGGA